jgi:hypothetical protein
VLKLLELVIVVLVLTIPHTAHRRNCLLYLPCLESSVIQLGASLALADHLVEGLGVCLLLDLFPPL